MNNSDLEVLETCIAWLHAEHKVTLVTVGKTWGSSPKPVGSMAAVRDDGVLVGSVSGGCVEKQLAESFKDQALNFVHTFHIDNKQARRYGLACGGELALVFETLKEPTQLISIVEHIKKRQRIKRTTDIETSVSTLSDASPNDAFSYSSNKLVKVFGAHWQVLIIGAGQLSQYVAQFSMAVDFNVLVCDPRPEFQKAWDVDGTKLLQCQPHEAVHTHGNDLNTAVLALTHEPNLDDMALIEALVLPCFYVGALGSQRNYERRCERLSNLLSQQDLSKLHSPIGLSIGSRSSAEIAISIVAELISTRRLLNIQKPGAL